MRLNSAWVVGTLILLSAVVWAAPQSATVASFSGGVQVDPGARAISVGDVLNQGDTVTLAAGARLSLTFPDGATMDVTGPASFKLTLLTDTARTIDLLYGTINRFEAKGITTGIRTPFDSFVAVQDGTVFVGIGDTAESHRTTFMLLEGENAKVVDGRTLKVLTKERPIVVDRVKDAAPPSGPMPGPASGESIQLRVGDHQILVTPKGGFSIEDRPGGGVRITRTAEGFGMVNVDDATSFYLYEGEFIDFDAAGNVVGHNGIIHVYSPLDRRGLYNEPVSSPAAASATGTKVK